MPMQITLTNPDKDQLRDLCQIQIALALIEKDPSIPNYHAAMRATEISRLLFPIPGFAPAKSAASEVLSIQGKGNAKKS